MKIYSMEIPEWRETRLVTEWDTNTLENILEWNKLGLVETQTDSGFTVTDLIDQVKLELYIRDLGLRNGI